MTLLICFIRLCICLFLTNLEIPIVVTALVGITDDLGGLQKSSWIVAAYLLGYVGRSRVLKADDTVV